MTASSKVVEFDKLVKALNKIIFGTEVETVTLNGIVKPTISNFLNSYAASKADLSYVNTALAAYVGGRKAYQTLALAQANQASLPANTAIEVTNDPTTSNNGTYQWNGTTLTKSAYDPVLFISKNISALTSYQSKDLDADKSFLLSEKLAGDITASGGTTDANTTATYVLNKNVASQIIKSVVIHSRFVGREIKIKAFKKGADRFTLNREIATLTTISIGFNYFILPEDILLASDEWLGFSCVAGSISFSYTSSPTALYYNNTTSTTATEVMLAKEGKTALLQIGFYSKTPFASVDINLKKQVAILQGQINALSSAVGAKVETIGYATPESSTNAGAAQWIIANPTKSGTLREFQTYSSVSGQLDVCIYERTGVSDFSPKYVQTVSVVQGFNIIELDQPVNVGDYLGIRTSAVGMTQYTQSTSGFSIYSHTNLNAVTGFAGPTGGFIWHFNFKVISTNSHAESNKWEGKTYTSFGDSITWYNGRNFVATHIEVGQFVKGYQSYIVNALGCTLDNKGESSWDMPQIYASRINTYDFTDCYLTTITSGANDCRKGTPVGTLQPIGSAFNTATYAGAIQASIEKVITSNPNTKIVLITPIRGWYTEYNTSDVPNKDPSVVGVLKREYPEMVKSIGVLYGIPVVDFYDELGWNDLNKNIYLGDDPAKFTAYLLHPNNKGYQRMGELLLSKLKDL